jgi:UDP-N-acetylglucosamine 2-epimerase (non-hydrolysing)
MKVAPVLAEMTRHPSHFEPVLLHTGQHYDYEMSKVFFEDLDLPEPHYFLGVGSGTHSEQTARIMIEFEKVLIKEEPDLVVVFGDVNSTLACSLAAKKLLIPVAHVEAGLRSFDMTMPEEINRKVTDAISDVLFTPSKDGNRNLRREGVNHNKIDFVGNIMIDSLIKVVKQIDPCQERGLLDELGLQRKKYVLVTLHRPSNVDNRSKLLRVLTFLDDLSREIPVVFPAHPRTKNNIGRFKPLLTLKGKLGIIAPLRYKDFIALEKNPRFVLTDSGGVQEETTFFNIPCLTLRNNTERPITITEGTNELASFENLKEKTASILEGNWKQGKPPELWDGNTAKRIVDRLLMRFENKEEEDNRCSSAT